MGWTSSQIRSKPRTLYGFFTRDNYKKATSVLPLAHSIRFPSMTNARVRTDGKPRQTFAPFTCSLNDFFELHASGKLPSYVPKYELFDCNGNPMPLLLKFMRDIVLSYLKIHDVWITHGDLRVENVSVIFGEVPYVEIHRPPGEGYCGFIMRKTLRVNKTPEDDLFDLGVLLFFCLSGGKNISVSTNTMDLSPINHVPELHALINQLLDVSPSERPSALTAYVDLLDAGTSFECELSNLEPHMFELLKRIPGYQLSERNGYPTPLLTKFMRDMVSGVAENHREGIIHGNLKPENVWITFGKSANARVLNPGTAGVEGQTYADDLLGLGNLLFFCICEGRKAYEDDDPEALEHATEAMDIIPRLLDPCPEKRPAAWEVLSHPFLWGSKKRITFMKKATDILLDAPRGGSLYKSLLEVSFDAQRGVVKWFREDIREFVFTKPRPGYDPESIREKLEWVRKKCRIKPDSHVVSAAAAAASNPETCLQLDLDDAHFDLCEDTVRHIFPRMLIELYKLLCGHAAELHDEEEFCAEYLTHAIVHRR